MEPLFLGLRHVALNVRDVQRALDFYSKVLGMKLEWMPDQDNAYLTSGQDSLALHKLPPGAEPGKVQTVHHIGFVVKRPENVDQWAERLRSHGISLAQEPKTHRDGARSFYFYDPDGLLIQLIYHPPISDKSL
ncbi:MAG TPA: VOC family protein [Terriglobia bacterium]|nr:VOC family protein [Terriglobia bacterium]